MSAYEIEQGTAVGVKAKDGVVLATDKRMAYGSFVMSRNAKKVFLINNRAAIAMSGLYADVGAILRYLTAESKYYELTEERTMSLYAISKLLSGILYSYKMLPFIIEALVGGIDRDGQPKIYTLDSLGSVSEDKYMAVGSGATTALGFLEDQYNDALSLDQAEQVAVGALRISMERDASTGDGIDVISISTSGAVKEKSLRLRVVEES
ncbi:Proteasome beta subunit [Acidilobus saccharovorans 345-15]|uniref:Proteasome subunit beta n=1 Tax=Acidilobus saccharovorans (strain DSM 16705 / JCM 18335 / VKM B-2471 / 345-15) TaxID=666510 RepID=D9Q218_ACIS3|nr:proteasome subunit beta [Acidilobus saccharovorans]ADL19356.1 Proteasome beta subunit [Acidilobus saccharovorans 345-15]